MSLLHPSNAGSPVGLWLVDGMPVRLVHANRRYRVIAEGVTGTGERWTFRARDESGTVRLFEVRAAALGWELVRVS